SPNLLLDGQLAAATAAPANGGGAVSARSVAGVLASTLSPAATSVPSSGAPGAPPVTGPSATPGTAASSQPPTTCSSRFRVIKLDHGSGEPYRRGRWTCMEYYERDSDSSVLTRSGDYRGGAGCLSALPAFLTMSKMPAKKKSCFQITSVTTAQVATSITEDTESLDDPDESRTEDVSSEIFDVSRATDYGPEEVCERSSSEETLNNVVPSGPLAVVPGVANVPAAAPAPSVPSVSTTSVTMPNVPAPLGQAPQLCSQPPVSRSGSSIQHVGLPLVPGTASAPTSLPQSDLSQFQTQTQPLVGQVDDTRRKSEPLPQPPLSLIAENKPVVKPPVADALANPLQLTPMNSLATSVFSIAIPVDGDEDRNPSTAFYQAFHLNTVQESKNLWDSASGGGGVAIDNKIEQAMDLVKSHLMYAVREEVEVLKEQIKELVERNSLLERENALLKSLSNNDQLSQLPAQQANPGSTSQQQAVIAQPPQPTQPPQQPNVSSA
ncbi:PREDICTED: TSC22 domain family protein 2, partial [Bison bison bison]|uniref:TSC22 domain family protein 2 n=1 Tax=Bison bison bison TaxID=43346 RepID=A0A6P3H3V9_BISBB